MINGCVRPWPLIACQILTGDNQEMAGLVSSLKSWMLRRKLQRQLKREDEYYRKEIARATTPEEQRDAASLAMYECSRYADQLRNMDSLELALRARRCYIDLSDFPIPEGSSAHWIMG